MSITPFFFFLLNLHFTILKDKIGGLGAFLPPTRFFFLNLSFLQVPTEGDELVSSPDDGGILRKVLDFQTDRELARLKFFLNSLPIGSREPKTRSPLLSLWRGRCFF